MDKKKLQWACRRGMLELDIMFKPFLDNRYDELTAEDKQLFVRLLDEGDQDLYEWLTAKKICEEAGFANMIFQIREYAEIRDRSL
jgi:antitoxin CptB